ncbi:MAG: hypothetical protein ACR2OL_05885, partial [Anderseniella sp.]
MAERLVNNFRGHYRMRHGGKPVRAQILPYSRLWQICHTFQNSEPEVHLLVDFSTFRMENSMRVIWFYTPSSL